MKTGDARFETRASEPNNLFIRRFGFQMEGRQPPARLLSQRLRRPLSRSSMTRNATREKRVWSSLLERMSEWDPSWRARIGLKEQPPKAITGLKGQISNERAFEAFAVALLSGNTRWERIESIRGELSAPFMDFRPGVFADLNEQEIDIKVLPWFRERRAGTAGLRAGLKRLRMTANLLAGRGRFASAQAMLDAAYLELRGSLEGVAMLLGSDKAWKLPGFGIALAAEALRLLGNDLCKPDRHILRAMAAWKLVPFARWERKGDFSAPQAKPSELLQTMLAVRSLANNNSVSVSYANSVIWAAGAISGARLTNTQLERLLR